VHSDVDGVPQPLLYTIIGFTMNYALCTMHYALMCDLWSHKLPLDTFT